VTRASRLVSVVSSCALYLLLAAPAIAQSNSIAKESRQDLLGLTLRGRRVSDSLDPNGFLLNPAWYRFYEIPSAGPPKVEETCSFRVGGNSAGERMLRIGRFGCTAQGEFLRLNEVTQPMILGGACASNDELGLVRGHINWFPVTISGLLTWDNFEKKAGEDHDVNIWLTGPPGSPLTSGNTIGAFELEFNSDETFGRLPSGVHGFWGALRRAMWSSKARPSVHKLIDNKHAIVTGLYGLDGVHDFQAELHPVFAMAILDTTFLQGDRTIQRWAFFARDRGNEGECSSGVVPFMARAQPVDSNRLSYTVDLGWLGDSTRVTLDGISLSNWARTEFSGGPRVGQSGPTFTVVPGKHLLATVRFRRPTGNNDDVAFFGEIETSWKGADQNSVLSSLPDAPLRIGVASGSETSNRESGATNAGREFRPPIEFQAWDDLVWFSPAVKLDTAKSSTEAPLLRIPVVQIPTVRGAVKWCKDDGWWHSSSCWPTARLEFSADKAFDKGWGLTVTPAYVPAHGPVGNLLGKIPFLGNLFLPMAYSFEARFERYPDAANTLHSRSGLSLVASLPTGSRVSLGTTVEAFPLVGFGAAYDVGRSSLTDAFTYGAGIALGRAAGTQWLFEWRRTRYSVSGESASRFQVGWLSRWPGTSPWCGVIKHCRRR
jgi:hypothetical protein